MIVLGRVRRIAQLVGDFLFPLLYADFKAFQALHVCFWRVPHSIDSLVEFHLPDGVFGNLNAHLKRALVKRVQLGSFARKAVIHGFWEFDVDVISANGYGPSKFPVQIDK